MSMQRTYAYLESGKDQKDTIFAHLGALTAPVIFVVEHRLFRNIFDVDIKDGGRILSPKGIEVVEKIPSKLPQDCCIFLLYPTMEELDDVESTISIRQLDAKVIELRLLLDDVEPASVGMPSNLPGYKDKLYWYRKYKPTFISGAENLLAKLDQTTPSPDISQLPQYVCDLADHWLLSCDGDGTIHHSTKRKIKADAVNSRGDWKRIDPEALLQYAYNKGVFFIEAKEIRDWIVLAQEHKIRAPKEYKTFRYQTHPSIKRDKK